MKYLFKVCDITLLYILMKNDNVSGFTFIGTCPESLSLRNIFRV